ncbi:hypothetical protein FVE85_0807 [Porphyridium purpureum]|uniref:Uncharacterized protein n=1 Tax=Porphyridium purpureum TaxID=35688 RepID=A0A5J4Z177_PORPP|nr:hypothetical protein FVE85_0807 [Porphyridium purpureum]|eukprot:POR4617..scf208_2
MASHVERRGDHADRRTGVQYLMLAIVVDFIGMLTPGVTDLAWAPVSALLIRWLFPDVPFAPLIGLVEELLLMTDIIPTATLAYFYNLSIVQRQRQRPTQG